MNQANPDRLSRALLALDGLSVGDAFGQHVFRAPEPPSRVVSQRLVPPAPWRTSDDTAMAVALVEVLAPEGRIDQDQLAAAFAAAYAADPHRGYGAVACWILTKIGEGRSWREVAREPFGGSGSMGNGAAMRVAPVGAWFADDVDAAVRAADASAEVTHAHAEGRAGAMAVAAAAVFAWRARRDPRKAKPEEALRFVAKHTPDGRTRRGILEAAALRDATPARAAEVLGDGSDVTAPDTVPFALWCALRSLGDYAGAQWQAMSGLLAEGADRDTIAAIVGGVVALAPGEHGIPREWLSAREPVTPRLPGS